MINRMKNIFIKSIFFLILISLLSDCKNPSKQRDLKLWVWMHADKSRSLPDWKDDFALLDDLGISGVLIGADTSVLQMVIPVAKKYGIEVHAWFWTMNRGDADTSWLSVNRLGKSLAQQKAYVGYYKFMCPALPEVKAFIKEKMNGLLKIEGLKGIHMDYVRYVDAILPLGLQPKYGLKQDRVYPEFDYGYHPYLRQQYMDKTGFDPLLMKDAGDNEDWFQFRLDALNNTVAALRDHIHQKGKMVTAAVFPTPAMSREMVRQEWDKWDLDSYFPMVYHNFYNKGTDWIKDVVMENRKCIPEGINIYCGLYLPALKNGNDLQDAMIAAAEGGADGIAFFEFRTIDEQMADEIRMFSRRSLSRTLAH